MDGGMAGGTRAKRVFRDGIGRRMLGANGSEGCFPDLP